MEIDMDWCLSLEKGAEVMIVTGVRPSRTVTLDTVAKVTKNTLVLSDGSKFQRHGGRRIDGAEYAQLVRPTAENRLKVGPPYELDVIAVDALAAVMTRTPSLERWADVVRAALRVGVRDCSEPSQFDCMGVDREAADAIDDLQKHCVRALDCIENAKDLSKWKEGLLATMDATCKVVEKVTHE